MNLLYLSTARIPSEKANTYQVLQMCDALATQGIDVTLLYPRRTNTTAMRQVQDVRGYYGLCHDFPMVPLPTLDFIRASGKLLNRVPRIKQSVQHRLFRLLMTSYSRSVLRYLKQHTADVYYTRNFEVLQALVRSRPELSQRIFYEAHSFPQKPDEQQKQAQALKQIGGVIAITRHLKELYVQQGIQPDRILVAPDGVDLRRFEQVEMTQREARAHLRLPRERFIVGYVGRLHTLGKEKGINHLTEAIAVLKRESPALDMTLCCVGGPEDMAQQYQALARRLGLDAHTVVFVPHIPPTQVPLYLRAFDLCAMPFPWTQHYAYYMSPLKLFEYMAAQKPIIATALPSVQELLRHGYNAYLVPPGDPRTLANGIRRVMDHPDEAQTMARNAREDVKKYSWEKRSERILEVIGRATARPSRGEG